MIGYVGVLTVACRGPAGPGEVQLSIRGGTERFLALADSPLPVGTRVLVVESLPYRTVTVVPWDDATEVRPLA